jgi:disulfide bond formation protein DsbB
LLFSSYTLGRSAVALGLLALLPIAGAWAFQYAGYPPCDLCNEQRYAYYVGVPLALLVAAGASVKAPRSLLVAGIALFGLAFLYNAGLAIYHSGVEAKLWEGPTACTGSIAGPASADDLLKQLETIKVVRCDEVSLRVFGLSLANWNVFISLGLALLAGATIFRTKDKTFDKSPHEALSKVRRPI